VFFASGSSSVANYHHTQRMNQLLTDEVKAACKAAIDSGADEILVNDSHGCCYNIFFEQLPPSCQIIHGQPGHFDAWLGAFEPDVDALICIGMHAMAGTSHSVCPHTMWHINNDAFQLSEGTMAAALAGSRGVPCVCVSGDDKICAEFTQKIPQIETAIVKWGLAIQNAKSLVPTAACEKIYQSVKTGLARREKIPPFQIPGPYRINLSDRNPDEMFFKEAVCGDDFWKTVHQALNQTTYGHFNLDEPDDKSFRWPN
jgi:D-amino peptidase